MTHIKTDNTQVIISASAEIERLRRELAHLRERHNTALNILEGHISEIQKLRMEQKI